ncbi:hypothetical protein ACFE04_013125 [Oxalis oulophora]
MGSNNKVQIPVINLRKSSSSVNKGSSTWDSTRSEVRSALEQYGCFEALFDGVSLEIKKSVFGESKQLFDLPLEVKQRKTSDKPLRGYIGNSVAAPLYEALGIEDPLHFGNVDGFANVFWSQGKPSFSKTVHTFSEKVSELDRTIRRMILESFGLEKYVDEHLNSTEYLLRFIKYKKPQTVEDKIVGLIAHTDKNFVTILHQNQVGGLELQSRDGDWIPVKPSSTDSFIVFAGETLYAWLNGWVRLPPHRVVMTGDEDRYTMALFSVAKSGYIVKSPEEMVDEEHPLLFKPFDYAEFLKLLSTGAGMKAECALKVFCGIQE